MNLSGTEHLAFKKGTYHQRDSPFPPRFGSSSSSVSARVTGGSSGIRVGGLNYGGDVRPLGQKQWLELLARTSVQSSCSLADTGKLAKTVSPSHHATATTTTTTAPLSVAECVKNTYKHSSTGWWPVVSVHLRHENDRPTNRPHNRNRARRSQTNAKYGKSRMTPNDRKTLYQYYQLLLLVL